jgi:hypothetical protein
MRPYSGDLGIPWLFYSQAMQYAVFCYFMWTSHYFSVIMSFVLVSHRTATVIPNIELAGLFRLQSVGSGHFVPKESTILLQL